jgi:hypothetical protein
MLNERQRASLEALCQADDLVPLPDDDTARRVQALLLPRVPRPGTGKAGGVADSPPAVPA